MSSIDEFSILIAGFMTIFRYFLKCIHLTMIVNKEGYQKNLKAGIRYIKLNRWSKNDVLDKNYY